MQLPFWGIQILVQQFSRRAAEPESVGLSYGLSKKDHSLHVLLLLELRGVHGLSLIIPDGDQSERVDHNELAILYLHQMQRHVGVMVFSDSDRTSGAIQFHAHHSGFEVFYVN